MTKHEKLSKLEEEKRQRDHEYRGDFEKSEAEIREERVKYLWGRVRLYVKTLRLTQNSLSA